MNMDAHLSQSPSSSPSNAPSTTMEDEDPETVTTSTPYLSPSPSPSEDPVDQVGQLSYVVATSGTSDRFSYLGDLQESMDVLAMQIASGFPWITVDTPTTIDGVFQTSTCRVVQCRPVLRCAVWMAGWWDLLSLVQVPCSMLNISLPLCLSPPDCPSFVGATDICQDVTVSIGIFVTKDVEGANQQAKDFEIALEQAIVGQDLQHSLDKVNLDSPTWIVTGTEQVPASRSLPSPNNDDLAEEKADLEDISLGAVVGMICGGLAALLFVLAVFVLRRKGSRDEGKNTYEVARVESKDTFFSVPHGSSDGLQSPPSSELDHDHDRREPQPQEEPSPPQLLMPPAKNDDASSSRASSSGWSSGGASPSTRDTDTAADDNDNTSPPNYMVDVGEQAYAQKSSDGMEPSIPSERELSQVTSDLDAAIQRGDWTAVGATAVLMYTGSSSDTTSTSVTSNNTSTRTPLLDSTIDSTMDRQSARSAELDRLVEMGDWEAMIQTAARFDAQEAPRPPSPFQCSSTVGSGSMDPLSLGAVAGTVDTGTAGSEAETEDLESLRGSSTGGEDSSTGRQTTFFRGSSTGGDDSTAGRQTAVSATYSEVQSKQQRLDEMRAEIERLIHEVVPEEIGNMEEMMTEFQGKEDELVETLRTMKERFVAQKARTAGRTTAQRAARQMVEAKARDPIPNQSVDKGKSSTLQLLDSL
jgi:hypothetical protein